MRLIKAVDLYFELCEFHDSQFTARPLTTEEEKAKKSALGVIEHLKAKIVTASEGGCLMHRGRRLLLSESTGRFYVGGRYPDGPIVGSSVTEC